MELTFAYQPGTGFIHRLDPRLKLLLLIILSFSMATAGLTVSTAGSLLAAVVLAVSVRPRIALSLLLSALRFVAAVTLIVILTQLLQQDTAWNPMVILHFLTQLFFWIVLGFIFTATTSITEMRAAVYSLTRMIPRFPAAGFALMVSVTLATLPFFFEAHRRNSEALASRGSIPWHRPVRRIRIEVIPLLTRLMGRSQLLSDSLLARGFDEERSFDLPPLKAGQLSGVLLFSVCLLFFMYLPALLGYTP